MTCSIKDANVLITGGLGFIGSNLAHRCLALGAKVTILDSLDNNSGGNLYNVRTIQDDLDLRLQSILDYDRVVEAVLNKDFVFNCAASTSHPFSMRQPWINMDVNVRGIINLLEAVKKVNKGARVIHIGTSTQLGPLQYRPADENHPEFPTDIYSANKSVSEKYALIYACAHGLDATVVRLSNAYGPRAAIHSPEFTFNNYFIGLALQDKPIKVFGKGAQKRNTIYVDDAVSALITTALTPNISGQALFAVSDEHFSIKEIAEATVKYVGKGEIQNIDWPESRKAIEIGDAIISNRRIKELTGWAPKCSLPEGLMHTKNYFVDCLGDYVGEVQW